MPAPEPRAEARPTRRRVVAVDPSVKVVVLVLFAVVTVWCAVRGELFFTALFGALGLLNALVLRTR